MKTENFGLPLLAAAQAQKHVTVNEALMLTDALLGLRVAQTGVQAAPVPEDGLAVLLAEDAPNDLGMQPGSVALALNGRWVEVPAREGLELDCGFGRLHYRNGRWSSALGAIAPSGASTALNLREIQVEITQSDVVVIPSACLPGRVVLGVTARVTAAILPDGETWSLGVAQSENRYGSGLSGAAGGYAHGLTGTPMVYFDSTPLQMTAASGTFQPGAVTLAVHELCITPPKD